MKELRSHDIPNAVPNKEHSASHALLGEPGHIGSDEAQGEWNVDHVSDAEGQAHHSSRDVVGVELPDEEHADHGDKRIKDHAENPSRRDERGDGGHDQDEDNLDTANRHLEQKRLEIGEAKSFRDDWRELERREHRRPKGDLEGRTNSGEATIGQVAGSGTEDQEPRLRVQNGLSSLFPFKGAKVHHTRLVFQCSVHGDSALPFAQEYSFRRRVRQQSEQKKAIARGNGAEDDK